jgi:hypothetical protein
MIPNLTDLRHAMGAVLYCPEHTETDIRLQDIDEKMQGHNLITSSCE